MDQFEPDYYTDLKQDEEVLITSRKDIEDIINESPIDEDMIVPSACCIDNEYWINPFASIVDDETPQNVD